METIKIDQEYITSSRVTKHYNLLVGKQEKEVEVDKWWVDSDDQYECDFEICEQEKVEKELTDDEYEALSDFISDLK